MNSKVFCGLSATALLIVTVLSVTDRAKAHTRITTDVTWSEHIRAIFIEKCMTCHHPGGIAPDYVDFTVYGTDTVPGARAWAVAIEEEILMGRMPPWKPDERFGSFSNVKELTTEEEDFIIAWVNGGGPQGPYRNLPVPEQFQKTDWSFGQPDLIFSQPQGHVVPADQQYDTAEVVLPVEIEEDTYITGFEFLVENPKNIFRMTAYVLDPEGVEIPPIEVEVQSEYDPLADEDEEVQVRLREMPKGPHFIGQWVRGDGPVMFPDAAGRLLRKGSHVLLRIEYRRPDFADWSEDIRDNSKLGFYIAQPDEEVDLLVESKVVENPDFAIKAGKSNQKVKAELTMEENVHLIGINPYLGSLAKNLEIKAIYPDGLTQTLMWIPEYKKRWTASYQFERPIAAPAGTRIEMIAHYDNSEDNWDNPNSPPIDVVSGPGRDDEQLLAVLTYTLDDHLNVEKEFVPRERPRSEGGGGMLFTEVPIAGDPNAEVATRPGPDGAGGPLASKGGVPPKEEGPIRLAKNGYHRVEAVMERPGEVQVFVYDDNEMPLDPHNFSGELLLGGDARSPLVIQRAGHDHLTSWVSPAFPVSFEAKLTLAGKEERFSFTFDGLTKENRGKVEARKFVPAPHGGWIHMVDDGYHRIEATLEKPGDLRLYFYADGDGVLDPIDPRNFLGGSVLTVDADTDSARGKPFPLTHASRGAEYLSVAIPSDVPVSVDVFLWFGEKKSTFRFDFDELTEEPWDDWGGEETLEEPLIAGPHGSPEIFAASNGFHFVEGTMPRPGEFRLYFYDEWKNLVDPRTFDGRIFKDGKEIPLAQYEETDEYLVAFLEPVFPVELSSKLWITGKEEEFTFSFDDVTIDPADKVALDTHMDHEPLHGGWFFMADNMFHHVEGAMPRPGELRVYFYDDFKQPIDPRSFSGAAFIERVDEESGEVTEETFELFYARAGDEHLTAIVPPEMPIALYAMISLGGEDKRFDFEFETLSVEPPKTRLAAAGGAKAGGTHDHVRPPLLIPETIEGILTELMNRDGDLLARIQSQDWNSLFIPAFDAKDLVAALEEKVAGLNPRQRGKLKTLKSAINRSVAKIERTAHSNDPPRVQKAYDEFADRMAQLRELYAAYIQ